MSFRDLIKKYAAEDNSKGTDKDTLHSYGLIYEELFKQYKQEDPLVIAEIGTYSGAFAEILVLWFPNSIVHAIDIDLSKVIFGKERSNLRYILADGTSKEVPHNITQSGSGKLFDIIIDDGSHKTSDQLTTANNWLPYLKPNGLYIIEDIDGKYYDNMLGSMTRIAGLNDRMLTVYDYRKKKDRFDDIVFLISQRKEDINVNVITN